MSNFEHRITEDSTEFEKAFLKIYDGNLWTALDKMKDWQPPKQLVVVPQCVANWFEENKDILEKAIYSYCEKLDDGLYNDFADWFSYNDNKPIETLTRMQYGYTVKKEVYVLKHIDLSKNDKEKDWYLAKKITGKFYHSCGEKGMGHKGMIEGQYFTQSEIDELETGSYEQITVKVEEAQK